MEVTLKAIAYPQQYHFTLVNYFFQNEIISSTWYSIYETVILFRCWNHLTPGLML